MLDDDGKEARGSEDRSRAGGQAGEEWHCAVEWWVWNWWGLWSVVCIGIGEYWWIGLAVLRS